MPTNIEIKARVTNLEGLRERAEALSATPAQVLMQEDTFFNTPAGRLKLRVQAPNDGQLVYYQREDTPGPKPSAYRIACTSDPDSLKAVLSGSLGVRGVMRKRRTVYMVGNTRVHLDEVEGLGAFMELEVVLSPGQSAAEGERVALELMGKLGIDEADLVTRAYMDLLEQNNPAEAQQE